MARAIVTGCLGQDGSLLSEYLISLDYDVYGIYKRVSTGTNFDNVKDIKNHPRFKLIEGDITDAGFINGLIADIKPNEYYGLAAMSHVGHSFKIPAETIRVDAEAIAIQLEAIRKFSPNTKFYNAATSELFGGLNCPESGYNEDSPMNPRSPYAAAKLCAYNLVKIYRNAYGLFAVNGILFNHSAPGRRGIDFFTRKLTRNIAEIKAGLSTKLKAGNLDSIRDEGCAIDYVKCMHLMLQYNKPDDYIVATGTGTSMKEMLDYVCDLAGLDPKRIYELDDRFVRPSDVPRLIGDAAKARNILGWVPEYDWKRLLLEMYEYDLNNLK